MQSKDLTAAEFFWEWENLIIHLSTKKGPTAKEMKSSKKRRESQIFGNGILLDAICLNPRNRVKLIEESINYLKSP